MFFYTFAPVIETNDIHHKRRSILCPNHDVLVIVHVVGMFIFGGTRGLGCFLHPHVPLIVMAPLNGTAQSVLTQLAGLIRVVFRTKKSCPLEEDGVNLLECIVSKYRALLSHKL